MVVQYIYTPRYVDTSLTFSVNFLSNMYIITRTWILFHIPSHNQQNSQSCQGVLQVSWLHLKGRRAQESHQLAVGGLTMLKTHIIVQSIMNTTRKSGFHCIISYSGNFSWGKIFDHFVDYPLSAKNSFTKTMQNRVLK